MSKPADQADHRLTKSGLPLRYTSYVIGVQPVTAVTLPITHFFSRASSR
jgi:hypothetical protein